MFLLSVNKPTNKQNKDSFEALLHSEKHKTEVRTSCEQGRQLNAIIR